MHQSIDNSLESRFKPVQMFEAFVIGRVVQFVRRGLSSSNVRKASREAWVCNAVPPVRREKKFSLRRSRPFRPKMMKHEKHKKLEIDRKLK